MRIGLTGGGSSVDKIVVQAKAAEADGFSALWYASTVVGDPVVAMAMTGRATTSIELGSACRRAMTTCRHRHTTTTGTESLYQYVVKFRSQARTPAVRFATREVGVDTMALGKFEQATAQLESALGERVLQCVGVGPAGQALLGRGYGGDSADSPFWRPYLTVNGQPHTPVPRTMFLILTPTRVVITGMHHNAPQLDAPILTLQRGDAEITAGRIKGTWTYSLRSRASGAELDLEIMTDWHSGVAAELAEQLREFSVTPTTPVSTPKLGYNRRSAIRRFRRLNTIFAIGALALSLVGFGIGAYSFYAYHAGTPTKATIASCSSSTHALRTCRGTWTINGESHRGRINGELDDSQQVGSSVDIHVFGGRAYATAWDKWYFIAGGFVGGLALLVLLFPRYRERDE